MSIKNPTPGSHTNQKKSTSYITNLSNKQKIGIVATIGIIVFGIVGYLVLGQTKVAPLTLSSDDIRSYIPNNANQIVYVHITEDTKNTLQQQAGDMQADMETLIQNVDEILIGQNNTEDQIFSFVVGRLKENAQTQDLSTVFTSNEQIGFSYAMITETIFMYAEDAVIQETTAGKIDGKRVQTPDFAPYIRRLQQREGNFGFFITIDDNTQALLGPAVGFNLESINHAVGIGSFGSDKIQGSIHLLFKKSPQIPNYTFKSKFNKNFDNSALVHLEIGPILSSIVQIGQKELVQVASNVLPLYDPSFQSLTQSDFETLIEQIYSNIAISLYPTDGTIPLSLRIQLGSEKLVDILEKMSPGLKNLLISSLPNVQVDTIENGFRIGFADTGEGSPIILPLVRSKNDNATQITLGNIPNLQSSTETINPPITNNTLGVATIYGDAFIDAYQQYASLLALVETGVVLPWDDIEKIRGKSAQIVVEANPMSVDIFVEFK